ncbi:hypothetical protein BMS3Abin07_02576 [bacterium BMS3Abin07]|nr:hypothetical protein BMS3Abin07_02576 [bacterium BMS3Abin07]GBE32361.1 hypothetical protein BMS3Bbin05_01274 [bacterium BMS3Bbin05]HDL20553.1 hypothetical protein [Nitrospirota bacterium]HDO21366.1 hypothetical protein [Nitrospirota bacterium]HDZ88596.1 hypothetical protein [Nitrospirota bacterium]
MYRQNSLEKKELKRKNRLAAGLLSENYPEVSGMVIRMTYYHKAFDPVLMERTVYIYPDNYAYFHMDCMIKGCENGGFDLAPVIHDLIKKGKKSGSGEMICCGGKGGRSTSAGHASISYNISFTYKPNSS